MPLRLSLTLGVLGFLVVSWIGACDGVGLDPRRGEPCFDQSHCASDVGFLRACIDNYCQPVGCLSTADCGLGFVCDLQSEDRNCIAGCQATYDCPAGSNCVGGQCIPYGCRTTVLDCAFGEVCNSETNECELAQGAYCAACDITTNVWADAGTASSCDDTIVSHPVCGADGSFCWDPDGTGSPLCFVHCATTGDCPGGYQCVFMNRLADVGCENQFISLGSVCVADCP